MILLDYRDKRPIYEQIVEKVSNLIVCGVLEPDSKMPSVRSFAMELSINPNTIQRAYQELEQKGYLYTIKGRGNFVASSAEWQHGKQRELLEEFENLIKKTKDAGIDKELLTQKLEKYYEDGRREDD